MAEAVVEDRPPQPQRRFFCHMCNVEVEQVTNEFKCPLCAGGFIEELPAVPVAENSTSSGDVEMLDADTNEPYFALTDLNNQIRDQISTMIMSVAGTRAHPDDDDNAQNPSGSNSLGGDQRQRRVHRIGGNFDNILHDFLISIATGAGGTGGGLGGGGSGGTPMFFMGNPGDYAWGREGLDTIVTQLLNQMDSTGPPPLPKDQIQEIPKVEITQEQVDIKLQCSVCWEDFSLNETVRKLSCSHLYHENCIVPWLQLHGTCPVCRKSFVPDYTEEQQRNQFSSAANSLRNVFVRSDGGNESTSSAAPTSNNDNNLTSSSHSTNNSRNPNITTQLFINPFNPFHQPPQQLQQQQQQQSSSNTNSTTNQPSNRGRSNNSSDVDNDDGIVEFEFD